MNTKANILKEELSKRILKITRKHTTAELLQKEVPVLEYILDQAEKEQLLKERPTVDVIQKAHRGDTKAKRVIEAWKSQF
jgi:hypothetical protein